MTTKSRTATVSSVQVDCRAATLIALLTVVPFLVAFAADEVEELKLNLPAPTLKGTPEDLPSGPTIEPLGKTNRPPYLIAKGVQNVALNRPVTSSVKPFTGELEQVTDGKKEAFDYDAVEIKKGTQWIQVDLGQRFSIQAVVMWHDHRYIQAMHDVIVQISENPGFTNNVQTVFNNDVDDSSGLGVGTDKEYFETHEGKIVDAKGVKGRYVRAYTKGGSLSALNCWQELEVYALSATAAVGAWILPPPNEQIATAPLAVVPEHGNQPVDVRPPEIRSNRTAALSTARARSSAHAVPTPARAEIAAAAPASPEAAAVAELPVATAGGAPAAMGLNWPTAFLASVIVITAAGLFYALRRDRHAVSPIKAK